MNILFFMQKPGFLRHFENVLRILDGRGHRVHVVYHGEGKFGEDARIGELAGSLCGLTYGSWAEIVGTSSVSRYDERAAHALRSTLDFLHYLAPAFDDTPDLRRRVAKRAPAVVRPLGRLPFRSATARFLSRRLEQIEASIPCDYLVSFLSGQRPDLVAITPFNWFASSQVDILRAARRLGIPVDAWIASWDHLTTKGVFHERPGRIFVWNGIQAREALALHALPPETVVVTGAHSFDHWFEMQAGDRRQFLDAAGLRPDLRYLCYLCSSRFIAPKEFDFIDQWVASIRANEDTKLREIGVLIRPHPQVNDLPWRELLERYGNVAVVPPGGSNPIFEADRQVYFDSIHHSTAVVGLNTSAMIEAAVIGRPVFSFHGGGAAARRTIHGAYLTDPERGIASCADSLPGHLQQLSEHLLDPNARRDRIRGFLERFVRPMGLDTPASIVMADRIEAMVPAIPDRPASAKGPATFRRLAAVYPARRRLRGALRRPAARRHPAPAGKKSRVVHAGAAQHVSANAARGMAQRIGETDKPVLVGPWLGEVGFELLYWIPFVRWLQTQGRIDPSRMWIISRGGVGEWYGEISGHYVELFELYQSDDLRARNWNRIDAQDQLQKQKDISRFDLEVMDRVLPETGSSDVELIHPSHMFELIQPYTMGWSPLSEIEAITDYQPLRMEQDGVEDLELPEEFIAVKFYSSNAFPLIDRNRQLVRRIADRLSRIADIVVLDPRLRIDDHQMFAADGPGRIFRPRCLDRPADNLAVQTRILSRARMLVGTYGGFSYLGALLGVDTFGLYSNDGHSMRHLALAQNVFRGAQYGRLTPMHTNAVESLLAVLEGRGGRTTTAKTGGAPASAEIGGRS